MDAQGSFSIVRSCCRNGFRNRACSIICRVPDPNLSRYRESASLPVLEDYPFLQLYIVGLKESYAVGERIDFRVMQKAGGCAYPESIFVKDLSSDSTVYEFNGTEASALLLCPAQFDPARFRMQWVTDEWTDQPITISEPGSYALVVKHLYRAIEQKFSVLDGIDCVSVVTIPQGSSIQEYDVSFKPKMITVVIGVNSTVKWINNDVVNHWIEADRADSTFYAATSDSSIVLKPGQWFEYKFDRPGTYGYHSDPWNQGTVIVIAAAS